MAIQARLLAYQRFGRAHSILTVPIDITQLLVRNWSSSRVTVKGANSYSNFRPLKLTLASGHGNPVGLSWEFMASESESVVAENKRFSGLHGPQR